MLIDRLVCQKSPSLFGLFTAYSAFSRSHGICLYLICVPPLPLTPPLTHYPLLFNSLFLLHLNTLLLIAQLFDLWFVVSSNSGLEDREAFTGLPRGEVMIMSLGMKHPIHT